MSAATNSNKHQATGSFLDSCFLRNIQLTHRLAKDSQVQNCWHFRLDNSLLWGTVLSIVGCLAASLTSNHYGVLSSVVTSNVSRHCCVSLGRRGKQNHLSLTTTVLEQLTAAIQGIDAPSLSYHSCLNVPSTMSAR